MAGGICAVAAEDATGAEPPMSSNDSADARIAVPTRRRPGLPPAHRRGDPSSDAPASDLDRRYHAGERSAPRGHVRGEGVPVRTRGPASRLSQRCSLERNPLRDPEPLPLGGDRGARGLRGPEQTESLLRRLRRPPVMLCGATTRENRS